MVNSVHLHVRCLQTIALTDNVIITFIQRFAVSNL